jgi:CheY-like chemotaxis protein
MKIYRILVADDDEDDFESISEAFGELKQGHEMVYVQDGRQLLWYLNKCMAEKSRLPDIILLDINMPRMNGIEGLRQIKSNTGFCHIPVLMHSTSSNMDQMKECYQFGADGFVTKASSFAVMTSLAHSVIEFLNGRKELPGNESKNGNKNYMSLKN